MVKELGLYSWIILIVVEERLACLVAVETLLELTTVTTAKMLVSYVPRSLFPDLVSVAYIMPLPVI